MSQRSSKILFGAMSLLYTSTMFYWVMNIICMVLYSHLAVSAASGTHSATFSDSSILILSRIQHLATPIALTINVSH